MKEATLIFIKKQNQILMINRCKPPFMGLWNAVGGKRKQGETLLACALREVKEETGLVLQDAKLISTFTWNYDDEVGYAYLCEIDDSVKLSRFPVKCEEGVLDFKDIDWILNDKNYGVIQDLRLFLTDIKNKDYKDYHLIYDNDKLVDYIVK